MKSRVPAIIFGIIGIILGFYALGWAGVMYIIQMLIQETDPNPLAVGVAILGGICFVIFFSVAFMLFFPGSQEKPGGIVFSRFVFLFSSILIGAAVLMAGYTGVTGGLRDVHRFMLTYGFPTFVLVLVSTIGLYKMKGWIRPLIIIQILFYGVFPLIYRSVTSGIGILGVSSCASVIVLGLLLLVYLHRPELKEIIN